MVCWKINHCTSLGFVRQEDNFEYKINRAEPLFVERSDRGDEGKLSNAIVGHCGGIPPERHIYALKNNVDEKTGILWTSTTVPIIIPRRH